MKVIIKITGQIAGNNLLKNSIACYDVKEGMFYSYILSFSTKKEAKKALWNAFKHLRSTIDYPSRLTYNKGGSLQYDASVASIFRP